MKTYYKTTPGLIKKLHLNSFVERQLHANRQNPTFLLFPVYNKLFSDHEKLVMFVFK